MCGLPVPSWELARSHSLSLSSIHKRVHFYILEARANLHPQIKGRALYQLRLSTERRQTSLPQWMLSLPTASGPGVLPAIATADPHTLETAEGGTRDSRPTYGLGAFSWELFKLAENSRISSLSSRLIPSITALTTSISHSTSGPVYICGTESLFSASTLCA